MTASTSADRCTRLTPALSNLLDAAGGDVRGVADIVSPGLRLVLPGWTGWQREAKLLTHSEMGDLVFGSESFELPTDPGLVMLVYTVEPSSPTAEANADSLRLDGARPAT